jgi:hypothetical protein
MDTNTCHAGQGDEADEARWLAGRPWAFALTDEELALVLIARAKAAQRSCAEEGQGYAVWHPLRALRSHSPCDG